MLAISAMATMLPAALGFWVAGGNRLVLPILLALFAGPTVMALFGVVHGALVDDDTDLRSYLHGVRDTALRSTAHSSVPALCLVSLAAATEAYARTGSIFALVSLGTALVATVLSVAGLVAALPLAVARPQIRGVRLWVTSWYLIGRWPIRFLAPCIVAGLGLGLAVTVSSTLVLLLPAPVALLASAAYWCCAVELGAHDVFVPRDSRVN